MYVGCTSEKGEGREEWEKSEAMVAMKVGDEYIVYVLHLGPAATQLHLYPFATVDEEEFLTDVKELRGTKMMRSG